MKTNDYTITTRFNISGIWYAILEYKGNAHVMEEREAKKLINKEKRQEEVELRMVV